MNLSKWNNKKALTKKGYILYLTKEEALSIAEGILRQIRTSNPNSSRPEFFTTDGDYFSVVVE
jgi:hypothetical protein